jgi:hypothetical protein
MADSKKDELVRFLEEGAFKPVLNAKPKGRSETEQKKLEHVQRLRAPRSSVFTNTVRRRTLRQTSGVTSIRSRPSASTANCVRWVCRR